MKTFKIIGLLAVMVITLWSCETEIEDPAGVRGSGDAAISFSVANGNFTPHEKVEFEIRLVGAADVSTVSVKHIGGTNPSTPTTIAAQPAFDLPVTDGKALFSKTLAELGMTTIGSKVTIVAEIPKNGGKLSKALTITIVTPVTFVSTGGAIPSGATAANGTIVNQIGTVATTNVNVIYTIANTKPNMLIDSIKVYRRIGTTGDGAILPKPSGAWLTPKDTIKINGANFIGSNNVQHRIQVFSNGVSTFSAWRAVTVTKHPFPSVSAAITLKAATNVYNLVENKFAVDSATTDIRLLPMAADNIFNIDSRTEAKFVKTTKAEYDNNDIVKLKKAFDTAAPASVYTQITDVEANDYYIYKVVRPGTTPTTKYGVILISSVVRTNIDNNDNLTFTYRYE